MFACSLQMADAMEMMILSILAPQLHCEWRLPSWQVALLTSVGSPAALSSHAQFWSPVGGCSVGCPHFLLLLPRAQQTGIKPSMESPGPQRPFSFLHLMYPGKSAANSNHIRGPQISCSVAGNLEPT